MKMGQPSSTAKLIALATVFNRSRAATTHLVPEQASEVSERLLRAGSFADRVATRFFKSGIAVPVVAAIESVTIPGLSAHYAVRKREIELQVRTAIDGGAQQLLVLGAGFDTLAFRLANEQPRLLAIEIDRRCTVERKAAALSDDIPSNLLFGHCDLLEQSLEEAMPPRFVRAAKTVVVLEGVTMYLPKIAVARLLRAIRGVLDDATLIFTFMDQRDDGAIDFERTGWLARLWLTINGEPFKWGCRPQQIAEMCVDAGWRSVGVFEPECARVTSARGEWIGAATSRDSSDRGPSHA